MEREDGFGQIKIRQPLSKLEYGSEKLDDFYEQIIADEVNVKSVRHSALDAESRNKELDSPTRAANDATVKLYKVLTPELKREGLSREVIRAVQKARKDAGLNVDDRIVVNLTTQDAELQKAIKEHGEAIKNEVLAVNDLDSPIKSANDSYKVSVKIEGMEADIQLEKEEK
jgi:isoleucyl-tRNA synthetase